MNHWHIRQAVRAIDAGGIVAYPTEAVFGLGCDPLNAHALARLLALKGRPVDKGLILIADRFEALAPFLAPLDAATRRRVEASWPGPVTWLLPARPEVSPLLRGRHDTLAVRVTAHPLAAVLCAAFGGALISTSANPAGRPPARSALAARRYFGAALDGLLNGPLGGSARPTSIRDGRSGSLVRAG